MKRWRDTTLRGSGGQVTERGSAGAWVLETFRSSPSVQTADPAPVTRYTDLRCPSQVSLDQEFQVTVRVTLLRHAESRDAQPLSVLTGSPVMAELVAPDFVLTEGATKSIDIPDGRDSDWEVFGLRPLSAGPSEVRVRFWQKGHLLGQAHCHVLVGLSEQPMAAPNVSHPALPLSFAPGVSPPKRILCVSLWGEHLHYSLYVDGARVALDMQPVDLRTSPVAHSRRLFARLSFLATSATGGGSFDSAAAVDEVAQMGYLLWNDLIPPALKARWQDERAEWAREPLLIVSDEAYIPWELVRSNESADDRAWGVHGPISRWLGLDAMHPARSAPDARLTLSPWAGLVPADSDLSFQDEEKAMLHRYFYPDGERTPTALGREDVLGLLAAGECGWLYAATHGQLDPGGEAEGASLLLEGGEALEPEVLVRPAVRAGLQKSKPGVFWNICHGATGGWTLTGVGGWAGRLIDGGASLFLAPQWTVTDRAARLFAETFYSQLAAPNSPGAAVAVQQARLAAAEAEGDPSWLAYALYAHPNARVMA